MQRKEMKPRWYFLKKKTSLKPEIFSIGTKQAGQGRRSIVPPEACLKYLGKFYPFTLLQLHIIGKVDNNNTNLAST